MKKLLAMLLMLAVACGCAAAVAEADAYSRFAGEYYHTSGAGGWYVVVSLSGDGTFRGHYEDQDYNADESTLNGVGYEWVLYNCDFTGRLSAPEYSDDRQAICRVSELNYLANDDHVEGDTRYEPQEYSGLAVNDKLVLYMAGAQRSALPQGLLDWIWYGVDEDEEVVRFNTIFNETAGTASCSRMPSDDLNKGCSMRLLRPCGTALSLKSESARPYFFNSFRQGIDAHEFSC